MKNFIKVAIVHIALLLVVISCKKNDANIKITKFPTEISALGTTSKVIKPEMFSDMCIIDTFLIILNEKGDNLIQIYSTVSNNLLIKFGKLGNGPGEFLVPTLFQNSSTDHLINKNNINIYDLTRRRITTINIEESLKKDSCIYKSERIPKLKNYINKIYYKNDSLIYYNGEDEGRYSIYNCNNSLTKIIPYNTPALNFRVNKINEFFIYTSCLSFNITRNKIAAAPLFIGQVDFFDLQGNFNFSSIFEHFKNMKNAFQSNNVTKADTKRYIISLDSNDDHIYALNLNLHNKDIGKGERPANEILIFDWQGQPVKKIKLDRYISSIAIDSTHNCLYGYAPYEHDYSIIKYNLE